MGQLKFHDDNCGEMLRDDGRCPACGFAPDMQSTVLINSKLAARAPSMLEMLRELAPLVDLPDDLDFDNLKGRLAALLASVEP